MWLLKNSATNYFKTTKEKLVEYKLEIVVFIYKLRHNIYIWKDKFKSFSKYIYTEFAVKEKAVWLLSKLFDSFVIGVPIWIIINYFNNPLSYGMLLLLITYHLEWFIKLIKK